MEYGEQCGEGKYPYNSCRRNQYCEKETETCIDAGAPCMEPEDVPADSRSVTKFGYCMPEYGCTASKLCVLGFESCERNSDCEWPLTCEAGECSCGQNTCGSDFKCCSNIDNSRTCNNFDFHHMKSCGVCLDGFANCDEDWVNGCETDLMNSKEHCGYCNNSCELVCKFGSCRSRECDGHEVFCEELGRCIAFDVYHFSECGICAEGFADCDNDLVKNGCETDLASSNRKDCKTCIDGWGSCVADDCRTELSNNRNHCGECHNACKPGEFCSDASCGLECAQQICTYKNEPQCVNLSNFNLIDCNTCATGYGNCNDDLAKDGCETDLAKNNLAACGVCDGKSCKDDDGLCVSNLHNAKACGGGCKDCNDLPNVQIGQCQNGICKVGACKPNYGNCNGNDDDGCETLFPTRTTA